MEETHWQINIIHRCHENLPADSKSCVFMRSVVSSITSSRSVFNFISSSFEGSVKSAAST